MTRGTPEKRVGVRFSFENVGLLDVLTFQESQAEISRIQDSIADLIKLATEKPDTKLTTAQQERFTTARGEIVRIQRDMILVAVRAVKSVDKHWLTNAGRSAKKIDWCGDARAGNYIRADRLGELVEAFGSAMNERNAPGK